MTQLTPITFHEIEIDAIATATGRVAVFADTDGKLDTGARRVNKLMRGALLRLIESDRFEQMKAGDAVTLAFPVGMAAEAVDIVRLPRNADQTQARAAGAPGLQSGTTTTTHRPRRSARTPASRLRSRT